MLCDIIVYSGHALTRMFERKISKSDVANIVCKGDIVADYFDDQPYPSQLLLGFTKNDPLHVVAAYNKKDNSCIVVTAYIPSSAFWEDDFKTRKPS